MKILRLALIVTTIVAACGWPPYDIDASSALWSARDMELIAEFAIPRGTGIVEPWSNPEVSFFPSIRFEPEGTSEQLGLFLFDYGIDVTSAQFFDAVRDTVGGAVVSGTPWDFSAPDNDENFVAIPGSLPLHVSATKYLYEDAFANTEIGDAYIFLIPDNNDYVVATMYTDPLAAPPGTEGSIAVFARLFECQRAILANPTSEWFSPVADVNPVAVGAYYENILNETRILSLFEDGGQWRIIRTEAEAPGPTGDCVDIEPFTSMETLNAPVPSTAPANGGGFLIARDLATADGRIVVSLPRPDGSYAVYFGTPDGTGLAYQELPGVTHRAIAVLSNDLIMVHTDPGYELVNVAGEVLWSTRTPSLLFTGEREHDGDMYLYFTSGYWARDDRNTTRYTRIYRLRTPR